MIGRTLGVLVAAAVFCLLATIDIVVGTTAYRQVRAASFPTVQGVVTHSSMATRSGSKGPVHGVDIRYEYTVDGQAHSGDTYRYSAGDSSDSAWARAAVQRYPAGATATVHYNPNNPRDAVLEPNLNGSDLFLIMFLVPFNVVFIGGPIYGLAAWLQGREGKAASAQRSGAVRWSDEGSATRVRLTQFGPVLIGVGTTAILCFFGVFVVGFGTGGGFHPSLAVMQFAWALILGAGAWFGVRAAWKAAKGHYDLVLDNAMGVLDLPAMHGRKQRLSLPRQEVTGVFVQEREVQGRRGVTHYYMVRLDRRDAGSEPLIEFQDRDQADAFAKRLRSALQQA